MPGDASDSRRSASPPRSQTIDSIIGVYDADGSVVGELSYFVRARLGRGHCALCDLTHGRVRERSEWRARKAGLRAPFVTFHRDDQPADVRAAGGAAPPVVLARTAAGSLVRLVAREALERCGGPDDLVAAIERAAASYDLHWPAAAAS